MNLVFDSMKPARNSNYYDESGIDCFHWYRAVKNKIKISNNIAWRINGCDQAKNIDSFLLKLNWMTIDFWNWFRVNVKSSQNLHAKLFCKCKTSFRFEVFGFQKYSEFCSFFLRHVLTFSNKIDLCCVKIKL